MKKLKGFIISFLITTFFLQFLSVSAESIDYDIALGSTIATADLLVGKLGGIGSGAVVAVAKHALENPLIDAGGDSYGVRIPSYLFVEGKYKFTYTSADNHEHSWLSRFSMFRTDYEVNYQSESPLTGDDGLYYIPNCLYSSVYFDDGRYFRYRFEYRDTYYLDSLTPSMISTNNKAMTIPRANHYFDVYDVSDGSIYGSFIQTVDPHAILDIKITTSPKNSIEKNTDVNAIFTFGTLSEPTKYTNVYPDPLGVAFNNYPTRRAQGSSSYTFYDNWNYFYSWLDSNSQSIIHNYTYNTPTYNTNNYTYNSYFQGGTIITSNNVNNYYGGSLSPIFDPDGLIDIKPDFDIVKALEPTIKLALGDLDNKITNFFGNMPDLNLPWDLSIPGGGGNNYLDLPGMPDIDLPDIPGGSGTVWQPPKYSPLNTNPIITTRSSVELVEVTFPTSVLSNGGKLLQSGLDGLTDCMPELVSVALVCMVFGFLWKFTGG